jgi:16S rRNA (cytosine1402-N4)-methyltransferase
MSAAAHAPVMVKEAVTALAPKENGVYVDATFGAGGYSRAILETAHCVVYGFDRDPAVIAAAKPLVELFAGRLRLINRCFAEMEDALAEQGVDSIDGVVFDLGVSSMQLGDAERGFSFMKEGPLSMRMDGGKPDAADVIAKAESEDLAAIFKTYGEEKRSRQIARAIVAARGNAPIETTTALSAIVERAAPRRYRPHIHPATRVFQALRIFVNDELGQLTAALRAAERLLRPAGRLVVVAFHSLEDRIVKTFFLNRFEKPCGGSRHRPPSRRRPASFAPVFPKALKPSEAEIARNPRARSARLRAGARLAAPPVVDDDDTGAPILMELKSLKEARI